MIYFGMLVLGTKSYVEKMIKIVFYRSSLQMQNGCMRLYRLSSVMYWSALVIVCVAELKTDVQ